MINPFTFFTSAGYNRQAIGKSFDYNKTGCNSFSKFNYKTKTI